MTPPSDQMLIHWSTQLRSTSDGERFVAAQTAERLKSEGFDAAEALDMMVAKDFHIPLAEEVVEKVYASASTSESDASIRSAMVVPTSYSEIAPQVESALMNMTARNFIEHVAFSAYPIVRCAERHIPSLHRLVMSAQTDERALQHLHEELTPWFEQEMLNSVLAAENHQHQITADSNHAYRVAMKGREAVANLTEGTCTCSRFTDGNFGLFGLACEHLVAAADSTSPYQRLMRAIREIE